jgi:hypothetical protein
MISLSGRGLSGEGTPKVTSLDPNLLWNRKGSPMFTGLVELFESIYRRNVHFLWNQSTP